MIFTGILQGQSYSHSNKEFICPFHCVDICSDVGKAMMARSALVSVLIMAPNCDSSYSSPPPTFSLKKDLKKKSSTFS